MTVPSNRRGTPRSLALALAGLVLFVTATLSRFEAAPRGLPYLHPYDEAHYSSLAWRMVQTGDLNPHFFNYPTFPTYLYALADLAYERLGGTIGATAPGSSEWRVSQESSFNIPETGVALFHRRITAVAGSLTCVLALWLGVCLGLPFAGFAGGALMALSPYLAEETAHAAVDPWMAMFGTLAIVALARPSPTRRALFVSAALAGVTMACKYTGVLVLLPALWSAGQRTPDPWLERAKLAGLAFVVFTVCTPFVLLDLRLAAHHILYEVRHYAVSGHEGAEHGRGFGNLMFHWEYLRRGLGTAVWLAPLGAAWLAWRGPRERLVLLAPAVYLVFMSLQRTVFGRNMDLLFAFAALCAAAPFELGVRSARTTRARAACAALAILAAVGALAEHASVRSEARERWLSPDSRSRAMAVVASLDPPEPGAVALELAVHGEDLARVPGRWSVVKSESASAMLRSGAARWAVLPAMTPAHITSAADSGYRVWAFGSRDLDGGPPVDPILRVWSATAGARAWPADSRRASSP